MFSTIKLFWQIAEKKNFTKLKEFSKTRSQITKNSPLTDHCPLTTVHCPLTTNHGPTARHSQHAVYGGTYQPVERHQRSIFRSSYLYRVLVWQDCN